MPAAAAYVCACDVCRLFAGENKAPERRPHHICCLFWPALGSLQRGEYLVIRFILRFDSRTEHLGNFKMYESKAFHCQLNAFTVFIQILLFSFQFLLTFLSLSAMVERDPHHRVNQTLNHIRTIICWEKLLLMLSCLCFALVLVLPEQENSYLAHISLNYNKAFPSPDCILLLLPHSHPPFPVFFFSMSFLMFQSRSRQRLPLLARPDSGPQRHRSQISLSVCFDH